MTTSTLARPRAGTLTRGEVAALATALFVGLAIVWTAGLSQAAVLHDAAHDTRHAAGFPCH